MPRQAHIVCILTVHKGNRQEDVMIPPGCVNRCAVGVQSRCCPGPAANRHRGWPSRDARPATPTFTERKRSLPPTGTSVAGSPHGCQGATTGAGQACRQAVKRGELNSVSVQPPGSLGAAMAGSYPAAPPRPQPSGSPAAAALAAGRWRPRSAGAPRTAPPSLLPTGQGGWTLTILGSRALLRRRYLQVPR